MSDFARYPNRIAANPGEVAVTGQRLARIERALFAINSRTLNIQYNGDAIAIDTYGQDDTDLSARPFAVSRNGSLWTVGANRAAIPALYIVGPWTLADSAPDTGNALEIAADGTLHLLSYRLVVTWVGIGLASTLATLVATPIAEIATLQTQNAVFWPLAWVRRPAGGQPAIVAQIEQGYCIHIPAVHLAQYPSEYTE